MWKLESVNDLSRTYRNSQTNSECRQVFCYSDREGNRWWEFTDLITIPFTRSFAASKITSLYAHGLAMSDVTNFISNHKATLRSKDTGEKYEKAYAEVLDFESKVTQAADPVRQMSSLTCVYYTLNDEPIDSFTNDIQLKKLGLLEADPEMHTFFLTRQISLIEAYKSSLESISRTVLDPLIEK